MNTVFEPSDRICLPVAGTDDVYPVHRVYCVGQNYAAHTREMGGSPERDAPFFFSKPADALATGSVIPFPPMTSNLHHEVELVVALGSGGSEIAESEAASFIFGYAVGVDLTRRDLQAAAKKKGRPWDVAKGFDCSGPVSEIVAASDCGHLQSGTIQLSVNSEQRQIGDLSQMIWSVTEIVAELSRYYELKAGDLIFTGTPAGVGPLLPGDCVDCEIDGVGNLQFTVDKRV
jgi:fumarylpyruvate hydrolase